MADLGSTGFTPARERDNPTPAMTTAIAVFSGTAQITERALGVNLSALDLGIGQRLMATTLAGSQLGTYSGTVQEDGVAAVGRKVFAYDRTTGALLGSTVSGAAGAYSIAVPGYNQGQLAFVVALDIAAAPDYNAAIKDKVEAA